MNDLTFAAPIGLLGLFVGSFLNVCIYRLPLGRTVLWGRSHCPSCDRQIRAWENVPVVSWLVLARALRRVQSAHLDAVPGRSSWSSGCLFAGGAWLYGPTLLLVARLIFACAMVVLFMIDLQHRILPNVITLPGIVVGLAFSLVLPPGFRDALIGAVACSLILFGMGELVSRVLGKEALGFGDVKMTAMMGAFLGWQLTLVALFLASFLGSVIGIGLVALTRDRDYQIPLGSFLAIGAVAAAVAGEPLLNWYVGRMFPQ